MSDELLDISQLGDVPRYAFGAAPGVRQPTLDELHAAFARELSLAASQHLRGGVSVAAHLVERMRYEDFLHSLGEACCLGVLRVDPPGADICLEISLPVLYPMIDRLLGGPGDATAPAPHRPLTQIERGLALQIIERAAAVLAEVWGRPGAAVSVREQSLACGPAQDVRIMPADEIVSVARFDVRFGGGGGGVGGGVGVGVGGGVGGGAAAGGTMSLCVPAPVEQFLAAIFPPLRSPAERDAARQDVQNHLLQSAVELRALLAETKLRLSDVLNMQPGDVITTEKRADEQVPLHVQGKEKFAGRLGQFRGARAIEITRGPDDPAPEVRT